MPHIHTRPGEHDLTASAFVIRTDFAEPRIMLHMHKKLNVYLQFGGHVETDEDPWQAVAHEVQEESGYDISQLKVLQPKDGIKRLSGIKLHPSPIYLNTHNFDETHYHTDIGFAFVTDEEPAHALGGEESQEILLLSRQEMVDLPPEQTTESVRDAVLYVFDVCLPGWDATDTSNFS